jgi:hypothetical protein
MGARGLLKETLGVIGRLSPVFFSPHPAIAKAKAAAMSAEIGLERCRILLFLLWSKTATMSQRETAVNDRFL